MTTSITAQELADTLAGDTRSPQPLVIDVRRPADFLDSDVLIAGALRRIPESTEAWRRTLPPAASVVVYCAHGESVSEHVADELTKAGTACSYLVGGLDAWRHEKGAVDAKPSCGSTRWITRERPKIDRVACPWLISRFIDPDAEFHYVPTAAVRSEAVTRNATPYDIPDTLFGHEGEACSFDAFIRHFHLGGDPALAQLATIVRGADTDRLALAPQSAGLLAISLGLSRNFNDDHEMLLHAMVMYDALYRWCREGKDETHSWNPDLVC